MLRPPNDLKTSASVAAPVSFGRSLLGSDKLVNRVETALVAIRRILRAADINAKRLARASGLTTSQLIVLQILDGRNEAMASEIARTATLSQATVTALVDKLEAKGFVARNRGKTDRRRVWVSITDHGRRALEQAPDLLQDTFQQRFEQLPDWEQAFIIAGVERVAALLDAGEIDAAPVLEVGMLDHIPSSDDVDDS